MTEPEFIKKCMQHSQHLPRKRKKQFKKKIIAFAKEFQSIGMLKNLLYEFPILNHN